MARGAPRPVVLVSFAGDLGGFGGMPTFEFAKTVAELPADKVFLRDPHSVWYLNGVPGAGGDPREVAAWLRDLCARRGARRVVAVGNSAGGWAAILHGVLMGADEVHAFVPKTRISQAEDFRNQKKFRFLHEHAGADPTLLDLRELLLRSEGARTSVCVHYPRHEPIDSTHARRLAGLPNVRLFEYRYKYHSLAKALRGHGLLRPLLANAVAGNALGVRLTVARGQALVRGRRGRDALLRPLWRVVSA